jgi:hypothetical protein
MDEIQNASCVPHCYFVSCKQDLVISVTPYNGDPDLYISLRPVTHPSRTNYTWVKASVGADVFTLQVVKAKDREALSSIIEVFYLYFC